MYFVEIKKASDHVSYGTSSGTKGYLASCSEPFGLNLQLQSLFDLIEILFDVKWWKPTAPSC